MTGPRKVELSVVGIVNGQTFRAHGTLAVDESKGTKTGTIVYDPLPQGLVPGPDCSLISTGRCFVGARPLAPRRFSGPLDLLGREFTSMRATGLGRHGSLSVSERASLSGGVLRSELMTLGEYRLPRIRRVGPLREVITVSGSGTLTSRGRYSLVPARGAPIPVQYTHLYESAKPDSRLFSRLRGRAFELRARLTTRFRGRALRYRSDSTISPVPNP